VVLITPLLPFQKSTARNPSPAEISRIRILPERLEMGAHSDAKISLFSLARPGANVAGLHRCGNAYLGRRFSPTGSNCAISAAQDVPGLPGSDVCEPGRYDS
jgi:hypothetical protein